ncbi:MAG TPA: heparan-alpha-glucosaminide N-acetyltransferase domain-containing protein [Gemmatimonadaceae bacterium]|jgi:uncharacterized membrane protein|nr:heparan-alpha-glucosaminide N-acetyltransferase domain-containing protein [Gemmatimonadaceae bacterium]
MATAAIGAAPSDSTTYAPPARRRVDSIDLLRGLVMVIMMLDHVRDYWSAAAFQFDPTDLSRTSAALFFTRWITHFCAPVFFFLAGTGAYLRRARGVSNAEMSRFLASRGVWLIVLELTVLRFLITADFLPRNVYLGQTIWALGWSMIVLALLVYLPLGAIAALGGAMVLAHNAFDVVKLPPCAPGTAQCGAGDLFAHVLHVQGMLQLWPGGPAFLSFYPLIPWIGVMALGYVFGRLYTMDAAQRRPILLRLGVGLIAFFVVLRATNLYGDPSRWSVQPRAGFTILSFLNTTKYPPSLLYLCMTLGPSILLLAFMEQSRRSAAGRALVTYGRVPMMYYLLQWVWAHGLAFAAYRMVGKPTDALYIFHDNSPDALARAGFSLVVVYVTWIAGVIALYPLCAKYAELKRRRTDWWLGYL